MIAMAPPARARDRRDRSLPHYNQDFDADPAEVKDFKGRIQQADAVVATPEYNRSYRAYSRMRSTWLRAHKGRARGTEAGAVFSLSPVTAPSGPITIFANRWCFQRPAMPRPRPISAAPPSCSAYGRDCQRRRASSSISSCRHSRSGSEEHRELGASSGPAPRGGRIGEQVRSDDTAQTRRFVAGGPYRSAHPHGRFRHTHRAGGR